MSIEFRAIGDPARVESFECDPLTVTFGELYESDPLSDPDPGPVIILDLDGFEVPLDAEQAAELAKELLSGVGKYIKWHNMADDVCKDCIHEELSK